MILDPDYARIFTQARVIAWSYGYTCAAIGSYTRDLDLLLVPWTERASGNHDQLLKLIAQSCGLRFRDGQEDVLLSKPEWTDKPHGRKACSLFFPDPYDRRWVDIGIIPCAPRPALPDDLAAAFDEVGGVPAAGALSAGVPVTNSGSTASDAKREKRSSDAGATPGASRATPADGTHPAGVEDKTK